MNSGNSSDWIVRGMKKGIDASYMYQDKTNLQEMLETLRLPHPHLFRFDPLKLDLDYISSLFSSAQHYFSRLVPFSADVKRPYHLDLATVDELQDFLSSYSLESFKELHLVERGEVVYSGVIIAQDEKSCVPGRCLVELVKGDGQDLFHAKKIPIHGEFNEHRRICFAEIITPTDAEKRILFDALSMVGGREHPFPGYYEFELWGDGRLMFRNYQGPETAYGKL